MTDIPAHLNTELLKIEHAIAAQEKLRGLLLDEQIEATLAELQAKRAILQAYLTGSGAIAQGDHVKATGERGVVAETIHDSTVITGDKNTVSVGQRINNFFFGSTEQQRTLRNRQVMLKRVKDFWIKGVLEQSLYNEVLIELGMEEYREVVEHPYYRLASDRHPRRL